MNKDTFKTRIFWMIQFKSFRHRNRPKVSWAGNMFDCHWEREPVCIPKKEVLVKDKYCIKKARSQLQVYLVLIIVRSNPSASNVQGEPSSIIWILKNLPPKALIHQWFVFVVADLNVFDNIWAIVGSIQNAFLDVTCIATIKIYQFNISRWGFVWFPSSSREVVYSRYWNRRSWKSSWEFCWGHHHHLLLLVALNVWHSEKVEKDDKKTYLTRGFCQE